MKKIFLISFLFSGMLSASSEAPALQGNESLAGRDVGAGALVPQPVPNIPAEEIVQPNTPNDKDGKKDTIPGQPVENEEPTLDDVESDNPLDGLWDGLSVISDLSSGYGAGASEKINALSEELEKVKNENKKVLHNFAMYSSQVSMAIASYKSVVEQKERFRESYGNRLAEEEKKHEEEIEILKRGHSEEVRKYEGDIAAKKSKISELNTKISKLDTEITKLREEAKKEKGNYKKLSDEVKKGKVAILEYANKKQEEIKKLTESSETIKQKNVELESENIKLQSENESLTIERDNLSVEKQNLEQRVAELEQEKEALEEKKRELESQVSELRTANNQGSDQTMLNLRAECFTLKNEIDAANGTIESTKEALDKAEKRIEKLEEDLKETNKEKVRLQKERDELRTQSALNGNTVGVGGAAPVTSYSQDVANNAFYMSLFGILGIDVSTGANKEFVSQCSTLEELFNNKKLLVEALYAIKDVTTRLFFGIAAKSYYVNMKLDYEFIDDVIGGGDKEDILGAL